MRDGVAEDGESGNGHPRSLRASQAAQSSTAAYPCVPRILAFPGAANRASQSVRPGGGRLKATPSREPAMRNPSATTIAHQPDPLTLAAATWLACGIVLLGLTPLPLHDPILGWSPAFWLLAAPGLLLIARRAFAPRLGSSARRSTCRRVAMPRRRSAWLPSAAAA